MSTSKPQGCAAVPFQKKKVAVFGTGGYMGATIFGFIQRASGIYGTGLSAPRAICATPSGSVALNKVIGRTFKLAYAGEDMVRLTNMQDPDLICKSISGMDAVILGTVYQLEKRSVALNTYEMTPNDKTYEFNLDDRYAADTDVSPNDIDFHLQIFQNSVDACVAAELKHLVVIETPFTKDPKPFAKILDDARIPFTYVRVNGQLENTKSYTFEEGIQSAIDVDIINSSDKNKLANWTATVTKLDKNDIVAREDVAALAVQSLLSLDWKSSRCLNVVSSGAFLEKMTLKEKSKLKSDKDWCIRSEVISEILLKQ